MMIKTKILIIEDDPKFVKTIRNVLLVHDYDVSCADNGASGIQKAFEFNPDLILCDVKMDPIDGYQVYNVLKECSLIDHTVFIFITETSEIQDVRFGMDLGVDDYFVKPVDIEKLIQTIEKRLIKYRKLKEAGRNEFKAIFNLTPNGLFLFDGHSIVDTNPPLTRMLGIQKGGPATYTIEDFIDAVSYQKIKDRIIRCTNGLLNSFYENVKFVQANGEKVEATLHVSAYEKHSGYSLMIGLVILNNEKYSENEVSILDVFNLLKKENIFMTESLGEKLINIFKRQNINSDFQKSDFFTKRENQVLCLSMEGLPIKLIADRLSISDRTVENHRAKLMEKTKSKNIIETITFSIRNNLIDISLTVFLFCDVVL